MRAFFAILLLGACSRTGVPLASKALEFPEIQVGSHADLPLPGDGWRDLRAPKWSVDEPFDITADPLRWPSGVRFRPVRPGDFEGTLRVVDGDRSAEWTLRGDAVLDVACDAPATACRSIVPGSPCRAEFAPEGSACATTCILEGRCDLGRCVGPPRDCSDGIDCTTDACDDEHGCTSTPVDAACARSAPGCVGTVRCDPALGCVPRTPESAIGCGPSNCTNFKVCRSGACEAAPALPDACALPTPTPVSLAWRVPGLVTAVCDDSLGCVGIDLRDEAQVVGTSRDGQERFRVPLRYRPPPGTYQGEFELQLMRFGDLVVIGTSWVERAALPSDTGLEAHRWSDGALAWTLPTATLLDATGSEAGFSGLALRIDDRTLLAEAGFGSNPDGLKQHVYRVVDVDTGMPQGLFPADLAYPTTSDGKGLFVGIDLTMRDVTAQIGLGADLSVRWRTGTAGRGLALHDGDSFLLGSSRVDASGTMLATGDAPRDRIGASPGHVWTMAGGPSPDTTGFGDPCDPLTLGHVGSRQSGDAAHCSLWARSDPVGFVLTARGTMLVLTRALADPERAMLLELDTEAHVRAAFELEEGTRPGLAASPRVAGLAAGRLVFCGGGGLLAYDLPDPVDPAPHGWITAQGSFDRGNAPR